MTVLFRLPSLLIAILLSVTVTTAQASSYRDTPGTFRLGLNNAMPLVFGMTIDDAVMALAVPLHHVSGSTGNEILLAIRSHGGGGYFKRADRLYLQFRRGRLTGWKGDWGTNWFWQ